MFFVLLVYSGSFLLMAVAVWRASRRVARIPLASSFLPIALFGLVHGSSELCSLIAYVWTKVKGPAPDFLRLAGGFIALLSFVILLQVGLQLLMNARAGTKWLKALPWGLAVVFAIALPLLGVTDLGRAFLLGRYTLGSLGSAVSAAGFFSVAVTTRPLDDGRLVKGLTAAGIGFAAYTVFGGLIVHPLFGVPVQVFRCLCALTIAVGITVATRSLAAYKPKAQV